MFKVLLFVLFAAQLNAESIPEGKNVEGIIDEIKKLIQKLADVLNNAVKSAREQINKALKTFEDLASSIIDKASNDINSVMKAINDRVEGWVKKATEAGVDVSECLSQESDLKNLPKEVLEHIKASVNEELTEVRQAVNEANEAINDVLNVVDERLDELSHCSKSILDLPVCAGKLSVKIAKDMVTLPAKIIGHATKVVTIVAKLSTESQQLVANEMANLVVKGASIVDDIGNCVDTKLNQDV